MSSALLDFAQRFQYLSWHWVQPVKPAADLTDERGFDREFNQLRSDLGAFNSQVGQTATETLFAYTL